MTRDMGRPISEMCSLHALLRESEDEDALTLAAVLEIEIEELEFWYDRMYRPEKFTAALLDEFRPTPDIIESVRLAFR